MQTFDGDVKAISATHLDHHASQIVYQLPTSVDLTHLLPTFLRRYESKNNLYQMTTNQFFHSSHAHVQITKDNYHRDNLTPTGENRFNGTG